jgi:hypothetical protein
MLLALAALLLALLLLLLVVVVVVEVVVGRPLRPGELVWLRSVAPVACASRLRM